MISEGISKCSKCTKQFIREGDMQRHYDREHTKVDKPKPKPFVMVQDEIMHPASPSIVTLQAKRSFFPRNTPRNQSGSVEKSSPQTPKEVGKTYFVNMPQAKGDNERPLHLAACCATFWAPLQARHHHSRHGEIQYPIFTFPSGWKWHATLQRQRSI